VSELTPGQSTPGWLREAPKGYRRLFYFTSRKYGIDSILNEKIKLSNLSKCNDVFEMASIDIHNSDFRRGHSKWKRKIDASIRLICFSREWQSPLMWGHYADRGEGVCLIVDVLKDEFLRSIKYITDRGRVNDLQDINLDGCISICAQKFKDWEYEEEERLFLDINTSISRGDIVDSSDTPITTNCTPEQPEKRKLFHRASVSDCGARLRIYGIINGPSAYNRLEYVRKKVGDKVKVFQCRPAFKSFKMTPQMRERQ